MKNIKMIEKELQDVKIIEVCYIISSQNNDFEYKVDRRSVFVNAQLNQIEDIIRFLEEKSIYIDKSELQNAYIEPFVSKKTLVIFKNVHNSRKTTCNRLIFKYKLAEENDKFDTQKEIRHELAEIMQEIGLEVIFHKYNATDGSNTFDIAITTDYIDFLHYKITYCIFMIYKIYKYNILSSSIKFI